MSNRFESIDLTGVFRVNSHRALYKNGRFNESFDYFYYTRGVARKSCVFINSRTYRKKRSVRARDAHVRLWEQFQHDTNDFRANDGTRKSAFFSALDTPNRAKAAKSARSLCDVQEGRVVPIGIACAPYPSCIMTVRNNVHGCRFSHAQPS